MTAPGQPADAGQHHGATACTLAILTILSAHAGWLSLVDITTRVAERLDTAAPSRDTIRRQLVEMTAWGWLEQGEAATTAQSQGASRWRLGGELPRLGLAWMRVLHSEMQRMSAQVNWASAAHEWRLDRWGRRSLEPYPERDPRVLQGQLARVSVDVSEHQVAQWSPAECAVVEAWITAVDMAADGEPVEVPPRPSILPEPHDPYGLTDDDVPEQLAAVVPAVRPR